jgi:ketosteroid isomerase-like protein
MTSTDTLTPAEVIRGLFAATDAKDTHAKLKLVTDDVRLTFANAGTTVGHDAFRKASDDFNASLDTVRHEITSMFELPDDGVVITELVVRYRRLDGAELALPCCNVFRLRDGRVADYRIYMDIGPVYT